MGIFLPSVDGSTEGAAVPEVDPDTRGGITHVLEHGRKY